MTSGGVIMNEARRGKLVARSTFEAEADALDAAIKKVKWLRGLLSELGQLQKGPTLVQVDNEAVVSVADGEDRFFDRSKHWRIRLCGIQEEQQRGVIKVEHIKILATSTPSHCRGNCSPNTQLP